VVSRYISFKSITEWLELESQICWMSVENGEAVCLQERGGDPIWSPDGERIAFSFEGIHIVDTRTRTVQTLVDFENDEKGAFHLDWSPDGKYLAYDKCYSSEAVDSCEIHVVSSDGKEHRRLTRNKFGDEFPVWQPVISATD
jgi:Tol biopolymer transport system component